MTKHARRKCFNAAGRELAQLMKAISFHSAITLMILCPEYSYSQCCTSQTLDVAGSVLTLRGNSPLYQSYPSRRVRALTNGVYIYIILHLFSSSVSSPSIHYHPFSSIFVNFQLFSAMWQRPAIYFPLSDFICLVHFQLFFSHVVEASHLFFSV